MKSMASFRFRPVSTQLLRTLIALIAVLLTAGAEWIATPTELKFMDEWLRDRFVTAQASHVPEARILVVDIDESSLTHYPWPWPRARLADLVEILLAQGARGVALDILQEKPADAAGDQRMIMLAHNGPLVLAQLFDLTGNADQPLRNGILLDGTPVSSAGRAATAHGFIGNHAGLAGSPHAGNIGVAPDTDGVLRHVPMFTYFEGHSYPTLALSLMNCCGGIVRLSGDDLGVVRIPYRHDWDAYTVAKAADVLDQNVPPELIKGRLVLIGSSSLSIGDRVATPLSASSAGLLVHAAILSGLLDRQAGLTPAPWPGKWLALLFSAVLAMLTWFTLARLSAAANVALLALCSATWLAMAYPLSAHHPEFSIAGPLCSSLFLLAVGVPFHWQLAQGESRRLLGTLRQYVAGGVVDELLRSGMKDPLAPRQLEVTTLIADLEGYTSLVETLPVEDAALLTTDFLDCLTRPVLEKNGTLDKYTGDGLVAFWGAPLPLAEHADLALDAAQGILLEVKRFSEQRVRDGLPPLRVRIGIESGLAMAGDFGTAFRSIYTAVGDSVNTASRLEQAARDFSHDVIIGEGTASRTRRHALIELGERLLRGKEKAIMLYTLEQDKQ